MVRIPSVARHLLSWAVATLMLVLAGEFTARLDDRAFQRIPFAAHVDRERDLMIHDTHCVRGRPHGLFKKYSLNAYGFRGPEISPEAPAKVQRVLLLGASETFGLYESEGHEFAELLRQDFARAGELVEVINVAVAGMTLPSLTDYWEHWVRPFQADWVLIYPSPQFYLDNTPPQAVIPHPDSFNKPIAFRSRLLGRLMEAVKQFELVKEIRVKWLLRQQLKGKEASWIFHEVPPDRVAAFTRDLTTLARAVQASGSKPVLVTHAFKSTPPLTAVDRRQLKAFRIFFPRAEEDVLPAFDAAAAQATIAAGRAHHWPVIDVSSRLSGQRDLFADPTHFNDEGSRAMADILTPALRSLVLNKGDKR